MTALSTGESPAGCQRAAGGLRRIGSAWRRRNLTFDKISPFVVFVIPVAFYIGFVVSPFVQAAYFSLTDWTGFTPAMNFIGLSNYAKLFTDSTFLQAMGNNILMADPDRDAWPGDVLRHPRHGRRLDSRQRQRLRNSSFYRVISFFPIRHPRHRDRAHLVPATQAQDS